jgi:hypothetical protein
MNNDTLVGGPGEDELKGGPGQNLLIDDDSLANQAAYLQISAGDEAEGESNESPLAAAMSNHRRESNAGDIRRSSGKSITPYRQGYHEIIVGVQNFEEHHDVALLDWLLEQEQNADELDLSFAAE